MLMKKLLIAFAFVLSITHIRAQNMSIGVVGGVGHAWTTNNGGLKTKFHPAYNLGGRLVYSFESHWGVSADVKFSSEGQRSSASETETRLRANYIRIPLQGIYFFGKYGDRVRPKISLGPSFGILVGGKNKAEIGLLDIERKAKEDIKSFDFGFTVAGGGNVRVAPATWLNLELAYYHGLADIAKGSTEARNRNLGVNVGITFPLATLRPENIER
jgi:hypothetical protein